MSNFYSIYTHGFVRVAVCVPHVRVADPVYNVQKTLKLAQQASQSQAALAVFPELGISAYSNEDLFHQAALLNACRAALSTLVSASLELSTVLLVGLPLDVEGQLFNCAVAVYNGQVLGVVPKSFVPNYREFYEKRQFVSARQARLREICLLGQQVPFGNDLIFEAPNLPGFSFFAEICEDLWSPTSPSTLGALGGARLLTNLSASNITIGKADYRRRLCAAQSAKCIAAYLYSAAGPGESTTDLSWDGYALVYENNELLAESRRFEDREQIIFADIDLERLHQDRMRSTSFNDAVADHVVQIRSLRRVAFEFALPKNVTLLQRQVDRFPYVPSDPRVCDERCYEVYNIQVQGLMKRLTATGIKRVVVGVSGGLDSTQTLIVAAQTMDRLKLPRTNILAYTMPGFATSQVTHRNASELMQSLGVTAQEINIRAGCMQMFKDIGHPFAEGKHVYDVTFENVQAGQRTSLLFRLANQQQALVLGTGDLSEAALGWTTYGVGDHMSHYNVNASVPKTLIQHLIRWVIKSSQLDEHTAETLQRIVETEISPELIPDQNGRSDRPAQKTEARIGPYELQDFNLYWITRFGFKPSKVAFLSMQAWGNSASGQWPQFVPAPDRREYSLAEIKKWLEVFLYRFFKTSQFKRSAMPNGPKVGSGGSLSPRGDWRAPSDSEATAWLEELAANVP